MGVALVTGTSTCIGLAAALHPARQRVEGYATLRPSESGAVLLKSASAGSVHAHYCAAKHALEAASLALAQEVRAFGIRVVVIEPGVVLTPIFRKAERYTDTASPYFEYRRRQVLFFQKVPPILPQVVAEVI